MNKEEAMEILVPYLAVNRTDTYCDDSITFRDNDSGRSLTLKGGDWSPEALEALAWWLRQKDSKEPPHPGSYFEFVEKRILELANTFGVPAGDLMQDMPTQGPSCENCKHWDLEGVEDFMGCKSALGCGVCTRVRMFWDATEWAPDYESRAFKPGQENELAFLQDGSDYRAWLTTRPGFSCNQWEYDD